MIKVVRKDTIDVPAGRFPAIVLQPSIKTNGLFSQNGHAEIWLSDDEHRILLRMDTHFAFITLGLQLRKRDVRNVRPGSTVGGEAVSTGQEAARRDRPRRACAPCPSRSDRTRFAPEEFSSPPGSDRSFAAFLRALPDVLVARDFLLVADAIAAAAARADAA